MVKVGFIGAGNMGTAIMKGIIGSGKETEIFAFDLCKEKLEELAKAGVKSLESENTVVKECKYIFLAVKPQVIEGVLEDCSRCKQRKSYCFNRCRHFRRLHQV